MSKMAVRPVSPSEAPLTETVSIARGEDQVRKKKVL